MTRCNHNLKTKWLWSILFSIPFWIDANASLWLEEIPRIWSDYWDTTYVTGQHGCLVPLLIDTASVMSSGPHSPFFEFCILFGDLCDCSMFVIFTCTYRNLHSFTRCRCLNVQSVAWIKYWNFVRCDGVLIWSMNNTPKLHSDYHSNITAIYNLALNTDWWRCFKLSFLVSI